MNRRELLELFASGAVVAGLPRTAFADGPGEWQRAFAAALERKPWLLGFRGTDRAAFGPRAAEIEGRLPAGLEGTLYRNGPARHEIGSYRYRHWFDGDGMVQAFRFGAGGIVHQGRMVATPKYLAEREAGRALYPAFGSLPPNARPATSPDSINAANISMLSHHDRLYTLWEAGSAMEIDPDSLASLGFEAWSAETRGMPFSAHPRLEPDGTLWNFGYASSAGVIVLWHIDAGGRLVDVGTVPVEPMTMPHDFLVTSRHIVLPLAPFAYEPGKAKTFLDTHRWHPDRPTRVLVVDKDDFAKRRWYELPAQWVFHYGNAWEDEVGVIRFDGARAAGPTAMLETFRDVMRGETPAAGAGPARQFAYRIDTRRGTIRETPILDASWSSEFPAIDPRLSTRRNRYVVLMTGSTRAPAVHGLGDSVSVLSVESGSMDSHRYDDHLIPEEHLFVPDPRRGGERDGWIVGTALDYRAGRTTLNVFDARNVSAGPRAVATLAYALPLGLHGKFVM